MSRPPRPAEAPTRVLTRPRPAPTAPPIPCAPPRPPPPPTAADVEPATTIYPHAMLAALLENEAPTVRDVPAFTDDGATRMEFAELPALLAAVTADAGEQTLVLGGAHAPLTLQLPQTPRLAHSTTSELTDHGVAHARQAQRAQNAQRRRWLWAGAIGLLVAGSAGWLWLHNAQTAAQHASDSTRYVVATHDAHAPTPRARATPATTLPPAPPPAAGDSAASAQDAAFADPTPRRAVELLMQGDERRAALAYRALGKLVPNEPVYPVIADVLERRIAARCPSDAVDAVCP